jgi:nucleoside-diphosphate-sugar epimerase
VQASRAAFVTGGSGFIGGALLRRLASEGWSLKALARSDSSARKVEAAAAEAVRGDLEDVDAMRAGASGCDVTFHLAAHVGDGGKWEEYERSTVAGTRNAARASREAGVKRFVHTGSEAALMRGQPLVNADETWPLQTESLAYYPRAKALAEREALAAGSDGMDAVVLRPRFVWGAGDTTLLPAISEMIEKGRFAWIGGGRHRTSTSHVDNVVEGLLLAAERGRGGEAYFVTDGEPVVFRDFLTRLLATRGVDPGDRTVPAGVARPLAAAVESAWRVLPLKGEAPLTRFAVWNSTLECTIDDSKARRELGYAPVTSVEDGIAEMVSAG